VRNRKHEWLWRENKRWHSYSSATVNVRNIFIKILFVFAKIIFIESSKLTESSSLVNSYVKIFESSVRVLLIGQLVNWFSIHFHFCLCLKTTMWVKPSEILVKILSKFFFCSIFIFFSNSNRLLVSGKLILFVFLFKTSLWFHQSRSTDRANPYFALQRRRGHDEAHGGFTSLFVATLDSVLDSKVSFDFIRRKPNSYLFT